MSRKLLLAIAVALATTSTAVAQVGNYRPNPTGYAPTMPGGVIADGTRQPIVTNASAPRYNPAAFQPQPQTSPVAAAGCGCNGGYTQGCDSNRGGCDGSGGQGCDSGCGVGQPYFAGACDTGCNDGCGRYFSVFGGWNGLEDMEAQSPMGTQLRAIFQEGWAAGGAFGRQVTCNRRQEVEFAYRQNSTDELLLTTVNGTTAEPLVGRIEAYSAMFNMVWTLDRFQILGATPYVGGGAGAAYVTGNAAARTVTCDIDDTAFAFQGIGGFEKQLNCRTTIFAEYRYFGTSDVQADCAVTGGGTFSDDVRYTAENIFVGLRITR